MSTRLSAGVLVIALLIGLACHVSPGAAGDPPAKESAAPKATSVRPDKATPDDWTGKVIYVNVAWAPVALDNVQLRQLGNQTFLVGRSLDQKNQPMPSG